MFLTGDLLISDMQSLQTEKCHTKAMYAPGINGGVLLKFSTFFFFSENEIRGNYFLNGLT